VSDEIQKFNGLELLFNYKPCDNVFGSVLSNFLGAKVMRNEWCATQAKCLSRGDQTGRHKDAKNCIWWFYDKTGALCFIVCDAFRHFCLLKFLSNSRHVVGLCFDKLLGVETLCSQIKTPFRKLDVACATFLVEHEGSFKPSNDLNWKNLWGLFLDACCNWLEVKDTFWLAPPVHIIAEMKSLGLEDNKLLELILLGAHQTSWFRFFYVGMKMVKEKMTHDPFKTCIQLADEAFSSLTGGPKLQNVLPGIDVEAIKALHCLNDCSVKHKVIKCILSLLEHVNKSKEEMFDHVGLRQVVLKTSGPMSRITAGTELNEFCLMVILQMCAFSSVVLSTRAAPYGQFLLLRQNDQAGHSTQSSFILTGT
jgi:hypothetical protein